MPENKTITISADEYKALLDCKIRVSIISEIMSDENCILTDAVLKSILGAEHGC